LRIISFTFYRSASMSGSAKALFSVLALFVFALVPLMALLNDGSFGKNVERGKYGLGHLAGGNAGRVLAAGDAGGKKIKT
jgi:hypothetical protein